MTGTLEISTPPEIAAAANCHAKHGSITIKVFFTAHGKDPGLTFRG